MSLLKLAVDYCWFYPHHCLSIASNQIPRDEVPQSGSVSKKMDLGSSQSTHSKIVLWPLCIRSAGWPRISMPCHLTSYANPVGTHQDPRTQQSPEASSSPKTEIWRIPEVNWLVSKLFPNRSTQLSTQSETHQLNWTSSLLLVGIEFTELLLAQGLCRGQGLFVARHLFLAAVPTCPKKLTQGPRELSKTRRLTEWCFFCQKRQRRKGIPYWSVATGLFRCHEIYQSQQRTRYKSNLWWRLHQFSTDLTSWQSQVNEKTTPNQIQSDPPRSSQTHVPHNDAQRGTLRPASATAISVARRELVAVSSSTRVSRAWPNSQTRGHVFE